MEIRKRLQKQTPDVFGVTAENADLTLSREGIRFESSRAGANIASVGTLGFGKYGSRWPCVENVKYNWLRQGPYKIRMYKRKNEILQIAAPWWGQHLIHPTSRWQTLRGCIAVGYKYNFDTMKLVNSLEEHCELMEELGIFELDKEFTLYVENNPMNKNLAAEQADWYEDKLRRKIRKIRRRAAARRSHQGQPGAGL